MDETKKEKLLSEDNASKASTVEGSTIESPDTHLEVEHAASALDKSPSVVSTTTFNISGKQEFGQDYAQKAHHQASFNDGLIMTLSTSISQWSYGHPIRIADLCCGHGKPTYDLLLALEAKGVKVEQITGYDISAAQIDTAKLNYGKVEQLDFHVQDVNTLRDSTKYDVVISLFGLHWMENINSSAESISQTLKPEGKVMFFVPLEKMDLFGLRQNLIASEKWNHCFKGFKLSPFIADEQQYITAFDKYFAHDEASTQKGSREIIYAKELAVKFWESWMQEVRHLKATGGDYSQYLSDLFDTIPYDPQGNVKKIDNDTISFRELFFEYQGKMLADSDHTDHESATEATPVHDTVIGQEQQHEYGLAA